MPNKRILSLDILRGAAALTVVFHHILITHQPYWDAYEGKPVTAWVDALSASPLHLLWGGHEAVLVFFVLSGFVLSIPFWENKATPYPQFVVKRFFRLYPAYIVATMLTIAAAWLLGSGHVASASNWANSFWVTPPTAAQVIDYLLMLATPDLNTINPVIWTLTLEMQVSLILPFVFILMRKFGPLVLVAAICISPAARFLPPLPSVIGQSLGYLWLFVLGAEIARRNFQIRSWAKLPLIALALALLNARWTFPAFHQGYGLVLSNGLGAGLLVACIAQVRAERGAWIGEMSYGIYLWHFGVIFALLHAFGIMPLWQQMPLALGTILALSAITYYGVEKPGMKIGATLARKVGP